MTDQNGPFFIRIRAFTLSSRYTGHISNHNAVRPRKATEPFQRGKLQQVIHPPTACTTIPPTTASPTYPQQWPDHRSRHHPLSICVECQLNRRKQDSKPQTHMGHDERYMYNITLSSRYHD